MKKEDNTPTQTEIEEFIDTVEATNTYVYVVYTERGSKAFTSPRKALTSLFESGLSVPAPGGQLRGGFLTHAKSLDVTYANVKPLIRSLNADLRVLLERDGVVIGSVDRLRVYA